MEGVLGLFVAAKLRINDYLGLVELFVALKFEHVLVKDVVSNGIFVHLEEGVQLVNHILVVGVVFTLSVTQRLIQFNVNVDILLSEGVIMAH